MILASTVTVGAGASGRCGFALVLEASAGFDDTARIAGNRIVMRDTTPPPTPVVAGWYAGGTLTSCLAWSAAEEIVPAWSDEAAGGAVSYDYEVTTPAGATSGGTVATTTAPAVTAAPVEGSWSVRVRARDAAGNVSEWSAVCTLHTDYTAPLLTDDVGFLWPHPDSKGSHNGITFVWSSDEVVRAHVYYDLAPVDPSDPATYAGAASTAPDSFTATPQVFVPFPGPGSFYYMIEMIDRAGNTTTTIPGIFNVPSQPTIDVIVLNEIMPNPVGSDSALMPDGEWVELANRGTFDIDVTGWRIRDAAGGWWTVSVSRGDNDGDPSDGGETVVPAGGYLVVYRSGASMSINNSGTETVTLLDTALHVMDEHTFDIGGTPEGKSVARFPDMVGVWIDPDGTPGDDNRLSGDERDALRRQTFETCFGHTARLIRTDRGSVCDPVFLAYIGMIADAGDRTLLLTGFLDTVPAEDDAIPAAPSSPTLPISQAETETAALPSRDQEAALEADVPTDVPAGGDGSDDTPGDDDTTEADDKILMPVMSSETPSPEPAPAALDPMSDDDAPAPSLSEPDVPSDVAAGMDDADASDTLPDTTQDVPETVSVAAEEEVAEGTEQEAEDATPTTDGDDNTDADNTDADDNPDTENDDDEDPVPAS